MNNKTSSSLFTSSQSWKHYYHYYDNYFVMDFGFISFCSQNLFYFNVVFVIFCLIFNADNLSLFYLSYSNFTIIIYCSYFNCLKRKSFFTKLNIQIKIQPIQRLNSSLDFLKHLQICPLINDDFYFTITIPQGETVN